jgi:AmmeMemoRadiSam system protein B/AmmeMemoRadiSam system protein A
MRTVSDPKKIRPPHFAQPGGFYTDDPVALTKQIAAYFSQAKKVDLGGTIAGLVCPHAGYEYSGAIAAEGYKQLEGLSYDTVVVISPSHQTFFPGASVYSGGAYRTPLGDLQLDLDFCEKLTSVDPLVALSDIGHDASGGGYEHSLEVHLPFLQIVLGTFALVPVVMGDQEYPTAKRLGELIGRWAKLGRTLVVASSDLAHGHSYDTTRQMDEVAATAVQQFSAGRFYDRLRDGAFEACGGGPITAAMIATEDMGADSARVLCHRNSGDVTGRKSGYLVGYLSAAFFSSGRDQQDQDRAHNLTVRPGQRPPSPDSETERKKTSALQVDHTLTNMEREMLRTTAHRSLEHAVKGAALACPDAPTDRLKEKRGAFVTLKKHGQLRGCIGYIRPYKPLIDAVWEMAESAALRDNRFIPVEPAEVDDLDVEITVLSPLERITNPDLVLVGRHGLLVSRGYQSGVLLPQVPVEADWDRETFLAQTCVKAGLSPAAWRDPKTTLEVFTAEVF